MTELSSEIYAVLRNCHIEIGCEFLRCGKNLGHANAQRIAREVRKYLGDAPDMVFGAYNSDTGHNDYVRINRGSAAFRLVCRMKS